MGLLTNQVRLCLGTAPQGLVTTVQGETILPLVSTDHHTNQITVLMSHDLKDSYICIEFDTPLAKLYSFGGQRFVTFCEKDASF